jgi:hypothetical protein
MAVGGFEGAVLIWDLGEAPLGFPSCGLQTSWAMMHWRGEEKGWRKTLGLARIRPDVDDVGRG